MDMRDFVIWLMGYFEISAAGGIVSLTASQRELISSRIDKVDDRMSSSAEFGQTLQTLINSPEVPIVAILNVVRPRYNRAIGNYEEYKTGD